MSYPKYYFHKITITDEKVDVEDNKVSCVLQKMVSIDAIKFESLIDFKELDLRNKERIEKMATPSDLTKPIKFIDISFEGIIV